MGALEEGGLPYHPPEYQYSEGCHHQVRGVDVREVRGEALQGLQGPDQEGHQSKLRLY